MKKVTPVLCILAVLMSLFLTVHADGNQPYELYLKRVDNNTGLMVMGFVKGTTPDSKYELVIPAEADYYYDDNMQKCELSKPLPVTSVISGAFAYTDATCEKYFDENPVTKITFSGSNLKTIGRTDVASLTGEVGSALEKKYVFYRTGNINTVDIPDSVTRVNRLFTLCPIEEINLGKGITSLGSGCLNNMTKTLRISTYASTFESTLSFTLIRQLEELRLCADSLNLSGKFNLVGLEGGNADKLKIYTKSSALKSKLVSLGYPSNNVYEHLPVDTVYDFGGNYTLKVTLFPSLKTARINGFEKLPDCFTDLNIPEKISFDGEEYTTTEIKNNAFNSDIANSGAVFVRNLNLPDTVKKIGNNAFRGCSHMNYAYVAGAEDISTCAFKGCNELYRVELGEGLKAISSEMFYDTRAMTSLVVPSTVTSFSCNAVATSRKLNSVAILGENVDFSGTTLNGIGSARLKDEIKFFVRNEATKNKLIALLGDTAYSIKVTDSGSKTLTLYDGYGWGIADVLCGDTSVILPSSLARSTGRYQLSGWTDGVKTYNPGEVYTFGSNDHSALKAVWEINPDYSVPLGIGEIKEAQADKDALKELVQIDELSGEKLLLAGSALLDSGYSVNVSVDENTIINDVNKNLFGVQFELSGKKFLTADNDISPAYLQAAENGAIGSIPVARWGGDSTSFKNLWANADVYENRKSSINFNNGKTANYKLEYGPVEFIKTVLAANPDASFVFSLSMLTMTPEDTLNFYRFLTDETGVYAELRKSTGIDNPVKLIGFELGNEVYHDVGDKLYNPDGSVSSSLVIDYSGSKPFEYDTERLLTTKEVSERYADVALAHILAVKEYAPEAEFFPVLVNNDSAADGMVWNRVIASKLGKYVNAGVLHIYYGVSLSTHKSENDLMDNIKQIFREEAGYAKDFKFAITEHSLYSSGQEISYTSLRGIVSDSMFMCNYLNRGDILLATYHNFYGTTNWSYLLDIDGEYVGSNISKLYGLYKEKLGNSVADYTVENSNDKKIVTNPLSNLAVTVKDGNKMIIVLTNTKNNGGNNKYRTVDYNFSFNNKFKLVKETTLTAPNYFSFTVDKDTEDIFSVTENEINGGEYSNTISYRLMPCRTVFLEFESEEPFVSEKINEGEKDNAVYKDLLSSALVNGNVYEFSDINYIDRVDYDGSGDMKISAQKSTGEWVNFIAYDDLNQGKFINHCKDDMFRAVKLEGVQPGEAVHIFSEISGKTDIVSDNGVFKLYPRINGADAFDSFAPVLYNTENISFAGNCFTANKTGNYDIEINGSKYTVNLLKNNGIYSYTDSFAGGDGGMWTDKNCTHSIELVEIPLNDQKEVINEGEGNGKNDDYTGEETDGKTYAMVIPVGFAGSTAYDSEKASYVEFNGEHGGLSDRQQIAFTISRNNRFQECGIKFMVHNNGNNYYRLSWHRKGLDEFAIRENGVMWRLYKAVGGAESCVATGWTYGNHVSGTDTIKFTVTVDRGNISWKGDSLSHKYNELYGSYSDPEPFCIGGNNSTFGFYGFLTVSLSESEKESCPNWDKLYIDNVSVTGLGNYDTEEHLILPFGAPSGSDEYTLAYRLNDDNTLSTDGFALYPTEEYIFEIPETADCYYNSDNICVKLKTSLPVRKIADNAFSKGYNSGGNLVTFSDTQPNDLLKGVKTGKELKYIGRKAFSYCSNEKFTEFSTYADVIFGDSLYNCNTVNTLTLNSVNLEIPDEKFGNSINLINVRTPEAKAALMNIGYSESQVRVYFELNMPCTDENGNRYVLNYTVNENGAKLNGFAETPETPVDMVIPKEISDSGVVYPVKSIADSAFEGSAFVKTVVISEGVESIGSLAFKNMNSLIYASVPGSVKCNLGSGVFKSCIFLKKCDLAEGITVIPPEMFYNCQRLSSAVLPSTVSRINLGALSAGANRLKEVAILSEFFVINSGYLGESGRFDDNWGYIGTKWVVVNDDMKELLESRISANPLYPQTIVVAAVSDPVVTFENGILTISNPDGCSKGISVVRTEYTDDTYSTVISETIEKISLYKNSVNYDFSLYEGSNKYKVFVFRDMESISPLCSPFEL